MMKAKTNSSTKRTLILWVRKVNHLGTIVFPAHHLGNRAVQRIHHQSLLLNMRSPKITWAREGNLFLTSFRTSFCSFSFFGNPRSPGMVSIALQSSQYISFKITSCRLGALSVMAPMNAICSSDPLKPPELEFLQ